jgi:hypothetical protein
LLPERKKEKIAAEQLKDNDLQMGFIECSPLSNFPPITAMMKIRQCVQDSIMIAVYSLELKGCPVQPI